MGEFPAGLFRNSLKMSIIADMKTLGETEPVLKALAKAQPVCWLNPDILPCAEGIALSGFSLAAVEDAAARLQRFAPYIATAFLETRKTSGIIESPVHVASKLQTELQSLWGEKLSGPLLIKLDSRLPVSGSVKARGGFYAVLIYAEQLAQKAGLLLPGQSYERMAAPDMKELFSRYRIAVGSTGNLGLSVGLMGATLGFNVIVHMSADAKQWKKDLLRQYGVNVVEHTGDYVAAVAAGRTEAANSPRTYFIDDENSPELFLGYAVAGLRLPEQLELLGLQFDQKRPLAVYLPCGVGGAPSGIAFGLKLVLGEAVRCYFAEPVQAPAVILGLASGLADKISIADIGLSGKTVADGLAVGRASGLACRAMRHLLNGGFTVQDSCLLYYLRLLAQIEGIRLEPSALAGFEGLHLAMSGKLGDIKEAGAHLVWGTGGGLVPEMEWDNYITSRQS